MGKYDLESLEKAAARVRAKLKDFNDRWYSEHLEELHNTSFLDNRELQDIYFRDLDEFLYNRNKK